VPCAGGAACAALRGSWLAGQRCAACGLRGHWNPVHWGELRRRPARPARARTGSANAPNPAGFTGLGPDVHQLQRGEAADPTGAAAVAPTRRAAPTRAQPSLARTRAASARCCCCARVSAALRRESSAPSYRTRGPPQPRTAARVLAPAPATQRPPARARRTAATSGG
jgi:hypothetical protein